MENYIYGHTTQENAYTVQDYPWGFRLRTTIRYWIETKKGYGQRFCSQTINPKTGKWCAPKCSIYSPILVMFLDENNHIKYTGLDHNTIEGKILTFKEIHLDGLDEYQKETLKEIMAYEKVMKHVTFTCKISNANDENEIKEKETLKQINRAISREINNIQF